MKWEKEEERRKETVVRPPIFQALFFFFFSPSPSHFCFHFLSLFALSLSLPPPPPTPLSHLPFFAPYPLFPLFAFITDDFPTNDPSEPLTTLLLLKLPPAAAAAAGSRGSRGGLPLHTTRSAVPANPAAARRDRSTYLL